MAKISRVEWLKYKQKEQIMPKVGDKKFKYTKAGKKAAKAYAKKKGLPVSNAMERKQKKY